MAKKGKSISIDPGKGLPPKLRTSPLGIGEIPGLHVSNSPTAKKQEQMEGVRINRQRGTGASRDPGRR